MSGNLTPLQVAERLIGRPETLAVVASYHPKSFYAFRQAAQNRDAGDFGSTRIQRALLTHSAAHGLGLTAEHLIWGAGEEAVAEILAARRVKAVAA